MKGDDKVVLVRESASIGIVYLVVLLAFRIVFYRQDFLAVVSVVSGLFYLFVIPGIFIMWNYRQKFDFLERLVFGFALCAGCLGIVSYHMGLLGLHVKYHMLIIPPAIILAAVIFGYWKK